MRKFLVLAAAIGGLLLAGDAGAVPLAGARHGIAASGDVTLVRDGCGRGFRWSNSRQACVPEFRGPPGCPPGFRWSDYRQTCVPLERIAPVVPACPPGFRWSNSRQTCVPRF
jgi:hypothetical protein